MKMFLSNLKTTIRDWWMWNIKSNLRTISYLRRNWWKLHSVIDWYQESGCSLSYTHIKEWVKCWLKPHDERITELEQELAQVKMYLDALSISSLDKDTVERITEGRRTK